jgi:hypothetical protein
LLAACENVTGGSPDTPAAVAAPAISVHPQDAAYLEGDSPAALSVEASSPDGGAISYQWYRATDSKGGGSTIDGATAASYTPGAQSAGTHYYYALVTNTLDDGRRAWASSGRARIQVSTYAPAISVQPQSGIVTTNDNVTLSVSATAPGDGNLSYQWYSNTTNSIDNGTAITGETGSTYTFTAASTTTYYYVVLTNTLTRGGETQTLTTTSDIALMGNTSNWSFLQDYTPTLAGGDSPAAPASLSLPAAFDAFNNWNTLTTAIDRAGKYVALDLSACTISGGTFTGATGSGVDKIVSLVLPPGATTISGYFSGYTSLTSISGTGVTNISVNAFYRCTALTTANFPAATSIGNNAFRDCSNLSSVDFRAVTIIGQGAFYECSALTTANFPAATSIGNNAFQDCSNLSSVDFQLATTIGESAFNGCSNLTTTNFPAATDIGDYAFANCTALEEVEFLSVASTPIGNYAFQNCSSLTGVNFPLAQTIGKSAFHSSAALITAQFPAVTSIGERAFANSGSNALTLTLGSTIPALGEGIFVNVAEQKNVTLKVPSSALWSYFSNSAWSTGLRGAGYNGSSTISGDFINNNITISVSIY